MFFFILLLGFCSCFSLSAQTSKEASVSVDTDMHNKFSKLKQELGYPKTKKIWVTKLDLNESISEPTSKNFIPGISAMFSVLGYILIAIIIGGMLFVVFKDYKSERLSKGGSIDLDNIENIDAVDFEKLLAEALAVQNYRLALRINFLLVLKELTNKGKIVWKPHKTNRVYVRELNNTDVQIGFRKVADIFEHIWYGVAALNASDYRSYSNYFDVFSKDITYE